MYKSNVGLEISNDDESLSLLLLERIYDEILRFFKLNELGDTPPIVGCEDVVADGTRNAPALESSNNNPIGTVKCSIFIVTYSGALVYN